MDELAADLTRVLDDVSAAVADWKAMRERLQAILADTEKRPPPLPADELSEGKAFLAWLADNHFTFLGYRCHELVVQKDGDALKIVPGSSLGILREGESKEVATSFAALPPEVKAYARRPELLVVTKSTSRSTVHRPGYLDYIAIKRFDAKGEVCGEDRFLGLFTSTAYSAKPSDIPLLRRKVANVVTRAGLVPGSHADKALINILENYPRDELFQITEDELLRTAMGILHLGERQRFRLFVRRDPFERFLSCLIYAPRENYTTELRQKWQTILTQAFNGSSSEFNVHLSESALARILITVRTTPGSIPRLRRARARSEARGRRPAMERRLQAGAHRVRGRGARHRSRAAFRRRLSGGRIGRISPARASVPDIQRMAKPERIGAARHVALPAARSGARNAALQALSPRRAGGAFRQPADAGAHGAEGPRRAAVSGDAGRLAADMDARSRHAVRDCRHRSRDRFPARGIRGSVRERFHRRSRERRFQPAGARRAASGARDRRPARLREILAADRICLVAGVHRDDARGARRYRARAGRALQDQVRSRRRPPARARGPRTRCARSRPRSRTSRIFRRIACCASTSP